MILNIFSQAGTYQDHTEHIALRFLGREIYNLLRLINIRLSTKAAYKKGPEIRSHHGGGLWALKSLDGFNFLQTVRRQRAAKAFKEGLFRLGGPLQKSDDIQAILFLAKAGKGHAIAGNEGPGIFQIA